MPTVIYYIADLIVEYVGTSYAVAEAIATIAVTVATSIAAQKIMTAIAGNQSQTLSNSQTVEYSGTVEPRRIIYGTNLVSGLNVIPPWCSGASNGTLHQLLVVAGHQVSAITDCYLNQVLIASANIGAVTGASTDGQVITGTYANHVWIRRYLGTATQVVDFILNAAFPAYWDSTHRLLGCAYVAVAYQFDPTIYAQGKPEFRCLVQGGSA